jgi:hypothetical protein
MENNRIEIQDIKGRIMQIQAHRVSSFGGLPINMFGFNTYLLVNFSREGLTGSKFEPATLR